MATKLQSKDIVLCANCNKPVTGEALVVKNKLRDKEKFVYHTTPTECANAPQLARDWKRIGKQTKTHNGTQARLQDSDGYSWDTNHSMSMR
jgi:hypothetical protein